MLLHRAARPPAFLSAPGVFHFKTNHSILRVYKLIWGNTMRALFILLVAAFAAWCIVPTPKREIPVVSKAEGDRAKAQVQRLVNSGVFQRVSVGDSVSVYAQPAFFAADIQGKTRMLAPVVILARAQRRGDFVHVWDAWSGQLVASYSDLGYRSK